AIGAVGAECACARTAGLGKAPPAGAFVPAWARAGRHPVRIRHEASAAIAMTRTLLKHRAAHRRELDALNRDDNVLSSSRSCHSLPTGRGGNLIGCPPGDVPRRSETQCLRRQTGYVVVRSTARIELKARAVSDWEQ